MILVLTYVIAALILGLYIAWFLYRYRRDQREKAAEAESMRSRMPPTATPLNRDATAPPSSPTVAPAFGATTPAEASPSGAAAASASGTGARTVAQALSGISMPHDLVPLTSLPLRAGVVDQVAFSSRTPVDVVGPAFADELERLGYSVTPLDERSLAAKRGSDNLIVHISPDAPPSAPDVTAVIEVCIPF